MKNFRWTHLNERLAYEQEIRKQRLRQEITLAKKESNFYIQNVEKSNVKNRIFSMFFVTLINSFFLLDEKRKRFEKKLEKGSTSETSNETNSAPLNRQTDTRNDDDSLKSKHPVFERKTKVVGNDTFLKQIFS